MRCGLVSRSTGTSGLRFASICSPFVANAEVTGSRPVPTALALEYGAPVPWESPAFASQVANAASSSSPPSVTVTLSQVVGDLQDDVYPFNYLGVCFGLDPGTSG